MVIDSVDEAILNQLARDGKTTTKELASLLGLTATPVFERIKKLERSGIIKGYAAVIDLEKIGKKTHVFCTVSLKEHHKEQLESFEQAIQNVTEVISVYHIAGLFDYLLEVVVEDMAAYERFIRNSLACIPAVGKVQSSFVMSEIKQSRLVISQMNQSTD